MKALTLKGYTPIDLRRLSLPIQAGVLLLLGSNVLPLLRLDGRATRPEIIAALLWSAVLCYALVLSSVLLPSPRLFDRLQWLNTSIIAFGLGAIQLIFPQMGSLHAGLYTLLAVAHNAALSGRRHACFTFVVVTILSALGRIQQGLTGPNDWLSYAPIPLGSLIIAETILSLQASAQEHIRRLEIVNEFARQSAFSLDKEHVLATLNSAFQNAIGADTYFVGILEEDKIRLDLLFDDGEYFPSQQIDLHGTLSGWVLRNNRTLLVADLREEPNLEDVEIISVGKSRLNLCWLGVPMKSAEVTGLLAVGSYRPHAFDRNDAELVENLAQHTAQALGNTLQLDRVRERTYLDSLTGVFNHGHFLKMLTEQCQQALKKGEMLSLVMMDIDYFKQYNDTYGHLAGDDILKSLCATIRRHIKRSDAVGRWGGEEFAISLPGAEGAQAWSVCQRIQETMGQVTIQTLDGSVIPVPSLSLGIAVFPAEAQTPMTLVHLADKRLYQAKGRGRNQIEPQQDYWQEESRK